MKEYSSWFAGYQTPIRLIFSDNLLKDISCFEIYTCMSSLFSPKYDMSNDVVWCVRKKRLTVDLQRAIDWQTNNFA